jgi:RNA polymerase sigma factor (sigma-70 family)
MAGSQTSKVLRHLRAAALLQDATGLTDGQLLGRFLDDRDEAAFAALLRRHGPMVWGVCRRLLNLHDAEDAFQATFLVLVRKAATVVPREMVPNWLYGVAHQAALQARRAALRRRARERPVAAVPEPPAARQDLYDDLRHLLDRELSRLPDKYRVAVILCDLEGKTRKEAAGQLGCPEGTLAGRLARARGMLARRLARHGPALSAGALAAALARGAASAAVPTAVASGTIEVASRLAAGQAATGVVPVTVASLTEGVLQVMILTKLKTALLMVLVFALLGGAGLLAVRAQGEKGRPAAAQPARDDDAGLKETLLELDKRMWEASTSGDTVAAGKLLAENYVSIWALDGRTDRGAALEFAKRYKYSDRVMRDVEVVRVSHDAAVLSYVCNYKVSVDNEEPRALAERRVSTVWGKRDGRWLCVFSQMITPPGE